MPILQKLRDVLASYKVPYEVLPQCALTNLHDEIVHTDDHDYREFPKQRQQVLKAVVAKVATTEQLAMQP